MSHPRIVNSAARRLFLDRHAEVQRPIREGINTSRFDRGESEDEGRSLVTFFDEKLEPILNEVLRRNAGEIQFHQRVREVSESLGRVAARHPGYAENALVEPIRKPARELAPWIILVNALCVGKIMSGQWERWKASDSGQRHCEFLDPVARTASPGRMGEAEEFANGACFLSSGQASCVTGTAVNAHAGLCPVA